MNMKEKTINSEILFEGKVITLRYDKVKLPNGEEATREIIQHPGGVGIVALDKDNTVLMVKQYRRPLDDLCLEIPAGKLNYGEDHRTCGIRELEEETGKKAKRLDYLGMFYPTPGFCNEIIHLYLAQDLYDGKMHPDEDEFLEVERYQMDELIKMIMDGRICDGKTIIGILKTQELLRKL